MRRLLALCALLAGLLLAVVPAALAAKPPKQKWNEVQIVAINDFHGHLEANTPGNMTLPDTGQSVPAGGAEYLSTHLKRLRAGHRSSLFVSAGDLIGASPILSGIFHDEPTIEAMNAMGLQINGVGNHEFDEGSGELLRMQDGPGADDADDDGCHLVDGCQDGTPFYGSVFQFLAANVVDEDTHSPLFPPYEIVQTKGGQRIAFIGETLEGTPLIVTPTGVAGLDFLDEAVTANRLAGLLRKQFGVQAFVLLLHQGGSQNAPFAKGYLDVNACENFVGPDLLDIVKRLTREIDVVVSAHTHQPYICNFNQTLVTSASSFGRVVTELTLELFGGGEVKTKKAVNHVVTQTVPKDPAITGILNHYKEFSDPIANRVVGSITESILSARGTPSGQNRAGEQPMGDVIADSQLEATAPADFGGSQVAFMNPGGVRSSLIFDSPAGTGGEITYGELFTVQPFGNSLVVQTCTGQQIYDLLEQQFDNPAAGQQRFLLPSANFRYDYYLTPPAGQTRHVVDGSATLNGTPLVKTAAYRVTMNSFLAPGGDGFSVFAQCTNPLGGEVDLDALVRYFQNHSPVSPPPLNRINRLD
jgi:5'-nucleotidase